MYSRSLDPRRLPPSLPRDYGGSAFRPDGTPTPIPVRREPIAHRDPPPRDPRSELSERGPREAASEDPAASGDPVPNDSPSRPSEQDSPADGTPADRARDGHEASPAAPPQRVRPKPPASEDAPFLGRLFGNLLPDVREDDLLLVLLLFLLSREDGNEEILLLLALLLFGK